MPTHRRYTRATRRYMPLALTALCVLLTASLCLLYSCSGNVTAQGCALITQAADTNSALVELDALHAPEGVDAAVFQSLKGALADALKARVGKVASSPPVGPKNTVNDFEIFSEAGQMRLRWHYRNSGDYDQNGVVGVADITPLAMHWQEGAFNPDSLQGVLDVDVSNKVDTGDITPIAMFFGVTCAGYLLQSSTTGNAADFSSIQSFAMSTAAGAERKVFMPLVDGTAGVYYRVCPYDGAQVGPASNIVQYAGPPDPPVITGVTPIAGNSGIAVEFTATVTGTPPMIVSWDFGGGATPNAPVGENVTVTLGDPGEYTVNVWAVNDSDTDNYQFTLTVS